MSYSQFSFPTPIYFGPGVRALLPEYLKSRKLRRPLMVTDRGVAGLSFPAEIRVALEKAGLRPWVFSEIWGNPVKSQVIAGVKAFLDHDADSIIGLGGGAALDVAKAIALMAEHPGDLFDYEDGRADALPVDREIPFWVAVPTTAGTGSEVGRSSVISDDQTHLKKIIFSPKLLARAVFSDPELTLGLPVEITAATGMDALTHCIEAYLAKGFHPICDGIALEGIALAANHLVQCVKRPRNIEARSGMMMVSMMGAIAFQKGLGLVHSCAHALSTVAGLHHGLANGIMIDHALRFNEQVSSNRLATIAGRIGLEDVTPEAVFSWLAGIKAEVGIPMKLPGIDRKQIDRLSAIAFEDACHASNPRSVSREDFSEIFREASV